MEKSIAMIASGQADAIAVLEREKEAYRRKFQDFVLKVVSIEKTIAESLPLHSFSTLHINQIEKMDELFEATFSPLASSGRPFSKCGKCRRYMHYINLRPARLHCRTCNETYTLPSNGNIKVPLITNNLRTH